MPTTQPEYASYLLRFHLVHLDDRTLWRASLQDTRTGEVHAFENVQAALDFLRAQFIDNVPEGNKRDAAGT